MLKITLEYILYCSGSEDADYSAIINLHAKNIKHPVRKSKNNSCFLIKIFI